MLEAVGLVASVDGVERVEDFVETVPSDVGVVWFCTN